MVSKLFRTQDNVPDIYTEQSRDFQLFCRLYDILFNGVKYDINSMVNVLDAMKANDRVLQLICTRVGFFPRIEIDANVLKYIVAAFPYLVKTKGTVSSIRGAVNTIIKAENNPEILINAPTIEVSNETFFINIYTSAEIVNKKALSELLRYVLPIGYDYKLYYIIKSEQDSTTELTINDLGYVVKTTSGVSVIRGSQDNANTIASVDFSEDGGANTSITNEHLFKHLANAYDTSVVVGSQNVELDEDGNVVDYSTRTDGTQIVQSFGTDKYYTQAVNVNDLEEPDGSSE